MKTRIISGCIMLPLLVLVYLGGYWIMAAAFLVGLQGLREVYGGFESMGTKPSKIVGFSSVVVLYAFNLIWPGDMRFMMIWIVLVTMASLIYGFNVEGRKIEDITSTLLGIIYVVFFSFHIVLIDQSQYSTLIWLVFLSAFGTDIMAYFVGVAIGKHKLCPKLSPKKSIEGAIGGVLGSVIFCGIFAYFVEPDLLTECMIIAVLGSIVAQFGDLSASALKRQMGIKDYSNLIPGHGGVMDRFDSVMFTAPLVYYAILFVNQGI